MEGKRPPWFKRLITGGGEKKRQEPILSEDTFKFKTPEEVEPKKDTLDTPGFSLPEEDPHSPDTFDFSQFERKAAPEKEPSEKKDKEPS